MGGTCRDRVCCPCIIRVRFDVCVCTCVCVCVLMGYNGQLARVYSIIRLTIKLALQIVVVIMQLSNHQNPATLSGYETKHDTAQRK